MKETGYSVVACALAISFAGLARAELPVAPAFVVVEGGNFDSACASRPDGCLAIRAYRNAPQNYSAMTLLGLNYDPLPRACQGSGGTPDTMTDSGHHLQIPVCRFADGSLVQTRDLWQRLPVASAVTPAPRASATPARPGKR